jgi:hypothetical protein
MTVDQLLTKQGRSELSGNVCISLVRRYDTFDLRNNNQSILPYMGLNLEGV